MEILSRNEAKARGLVRYFTGIPCRCGHVSERFVSEGACVDCKNTAYRNRYAKNPDKHRIKSRKQYWSEPDVWRNRRREYQKRAPEAYLQKARERTRQWALDNPDRAMRNTKVAKQKRRSRERSAPGTFIANDLVALFAAQAGRCIYCKEELGRKYHVDHVVPLSKGGTNDPSNLQLLCAPCNLSKAARDPIVYAQSLGMLL